MPTIRTLAPAPCEHSRQSGRLSFDANGLVAHIACDDCGELLRYLPNATAEARAERARAQRTSLLAA